MTRSPSRASKLGKTFVQEQVTPDDYCASSNLDLHVHVQSSYCEAWGISLQENLVL